jgi:hypothetical protein
MALELKVNVALPVGAKRRDGVVKVPLLVSKLPATVTCVADIVAAELLVVAPEVPVVLSVMSVPVIEPALVIAGPVPPADNVRDWVPLGPDEIAPLFIIVLAVIVPLALMDPLASTVVDPLEERLIVPTVTALVTSVLPVAMIVSWLATVEAPRVRLPVCCNQPLRPVVSSVRIPALS